MSLGTTYSPAGTVGGAASYKLWPVFAYSNGYWEVYRRFQGDFFWFGGRVEGGLRGRIFQWRNVLLGKRLSMEGLQDFLALFKKKNYEKKYEKFFLLKVRSSIKT